MLYSETKQKQHIKMKTRSYLIYAVCAFLQSCTLVDAQVVWLSPKNMDFTDCDREERYVERFESVSNTCPFDVIYEQSDDRYVIVEGDEYYFDRIHTDVKRGVLEITVDPARCRNVRLRVKVGSPYITHLTMSGSGSIQCTTDITTRNDMSIRILGSGDILTRQISCGNLQTSISGSGDLKVYGIDAADISLSIAGSGDWGATDIKADNMSISIAGSGDVKITSAEIDNKLSANVAGSGDIRMNGQATNIEAKIIGTGDISGRMTYKNISKSRIGSGDIDW